MRPEVRAHALLAIGIAGAIAGVAQGLPLGVVASCCCTPWSMIGAIGAVLLVVQRAKIRVEPAEGAVIGLGVGVIAGSLGGGLGALRELLSQSTGFVVPFLRDRDSVMGFGIAQYLWGALVVFLAHFLFGLVLGPLGGLVGSAVLRPPTYSAPPPRAIDQ